MSQVTKFLVITFIKSIRCMIYNRIRYLTYNLRLHWMQFNKSDQHFVTWLWIFPVISGRYSSIGRTFFQNWLSFNNAKFSNSPPNFRIFGLRRRIVGEAARIWWRHQARLQCLNPRQQHDEKWNKFKWHHGGSKPWQPHTSHRKCEKNWGTKLSARKFGPQNCPASGYGNFVPQFFHRFGDTMYAYHDNATWKNDYRVDHINPDNVKCVLEVKQGNIR